MGARSTADRSVSLRSLRARARLSRIAVIVVAVVLSVAGLKSIARSTDDVRSTTPTEAHDVGGADALAEAFARAYLSTDPAAPEAREKRLTAFGMPESTLAADRLDGPPVTVGWTASMASTPAGHGQRRVTVAVDAGNRTVYLAVTVGRTTGGRLFVTGPPAFVGPPAIAKGQSAPEPEVDDQALQAVATRALRHYLQGDRGDLAADLAPRAVGSSPAVPLTVMEVLAVTWAAAPSRVAVHVLARLAGGSSFVLRYELAVVRVGGRWLVRRIHVNPLDREDS